MGQNMIESSQLFQRFAETPSGKLIQTRARFDAYAMKPSLVSTQEWQSLLGDDVNNLFHLSRSVEIVDLYQSLDHDADHSIPVQYSALRSAFSNKYDLLRVVGVIHDIQEALNGDLNYHDKNEETERQERFSFMMLSEWVYGDIFTYDMRQELASIIFDHDSELGKEFSIVEKIGYMTTALRASEVYGDDEHIREVFREVDAVKVQELKFGLGQIVAHVLPYQIPQLGSEAEHSVPAGNFLVQMKDRIDRALLVVPGSPKIANTFSEWNSFCQRKGIAPHYDRSSGT